MSKQTIEGAIVELLLSTPSIATKIGSRITPLVRDAEEPLPAIVYSGGDPERERYLDGSFSEMASLLMAFEVWGYGYMETKTLLSTVIATLNNASGNLYGHQVLTINCEPGQESRDWDSNTMVIEFTAEITVKVE